MTDDVFFGEPHVGDIPDARESSAVVALQGTFETFPSRVFFSRQLEVWQEADYFHWITNRALRDLVADGVVVSEVRPLGTGNTVTLMWHRSYRYPRREAARVIALVEEYADHNIGAAIGIQGEYLVLEGFARHQFLLQGRETRAFRDRVWTETQHDLDFIFERDGVAYGVEVKNTLGYMDHNELQVKIRMCRYLGIRPLFAVRMIPKSWTNEVVQAGGFALILKYQLYPVAHRELAQRVRDTFGLPVDSPRALQDGTMQRFLNWHERQL